MKKELITRVEADEKIADLKNELDEQKRVCKSKDERLDKIESRWNIMIAILKTSVTAPVVLGSYALLYHVWIFIASGGTKGIMVGIPHSSELPYTLDMTSGSCLGIVMLVLFILLSLGWAFLFMLLSEDD